MAKLLKFPLHTHEEPSVYFVDILVKIDDVAIVVGDELCYLCNDAQLVRAVQ